MPHRLLRLAEAIRTRQDALHPTGRAVRRPAARAATRRAAGREVNDNGFPEDSPFVAPPDPKWSGPGIILSLGTQDGRHRMGAVRAAARETSGDPAADAAILLRLLEHYGAWMGFEGQVDPVRPGEMRRLPAVRRAPASVEYRMDLRKISRNSQSLTADGTILVDGRPAAVLDGVSIVFRSARPDSRPPIESRNLRDA